MGMAAHLLCQKLSIIISSCAIIFVGTCEQMGDVIIDRAADSRSDRRVALPNSVLLRKGERGLSNNCILLFGLLRRG
jgi:hypothetical protein